MSPPKTVGQAPGRDSTTRRALIRATAQVMLEEGYAAATSRRVAAQAGVKPALVHYYFPSMDDLFVAVLQAGAETNLGTQQDAFADDAPLHALWELNNTQGAALWMEFMALANHRKAIRTEIAGYADRFRDLEEAAMASALQAHGVDTDEFPPVVMSMIVASLARILVLEQGLGISRGHAQAQDFVRRYLDRFELPPGDPA
ncbi:MULTISPECIES: TetR/AcrR family transcriptional regulator [unclassified Mycolicibacterium]|uniref:TetR/AcrR family transcriptional regulator n=1 Tax=unclassified Mycolicibacterium TaxID=2636767 RepID=UPI0012DCCEC1|nr:MULTISPECIES: TetR/AcrR family transcriptional regulator [unclassified Mycolicibacterium]MUL85409.1 TetR/AcrR family transcriptional regulator [Mycolicibacterium sp. CBMA 329]MUL88827.1 TetR/AcrR family transcriptional regulator [Mycolicibacterium sp. CBMA 331]MUM01899.1 TetR/AcrR family transcriptional regulator [Mycolicibacterium sp. CBMA 334]MUM24917.1 TetR/AcrR family transcriptional regulator [Mycolicibacterium sp. CBMA 295]MUM40474.1 TetR/AcrR family transcriptional regulator [Mycolic